MGEWSGRAIESISWREGVELPRVGRRKRRDSRRDRRGDSSAEGSSNSIQLIHHLKRRWLLPGTGVSAPPKGGKAQSREKKSYCTRAGLGRKKSDFFPPETLPPRKGA